MNEGMRRDAQRRHERGVGHGHDAWGQGGEGEEGGEGGEVGAGEGAEHDDGFGCMMPGREEDESSDTESTEEAITGRTDADTAVGADVDKKARVNRARVQGGGAAGRRPASPSNRAGMGRLSDPGSRVGRCRLTV